MSTATSTLLGRPLWYELVTTDAAAAMKFYSEPFGWKESQAMDMGPMVRMTEVSDGDE